MRPYNYSSQLVSNLTICLLLLFSMGTAIAQEETARNYFDLRDNNAITFGGGLATPNIDFPDPGFDYYYTIGIERHIFSGLSLRLDYHKFVLTNNQKFDKGFMSFDLNLHYLVFRYSRLSPFVFVGGGYHAANYFDDTAAKLQGGGGIEFVLTRGIAITAFGDYNYVFSDLVDGVAYAQANDTYIRFGVGAKIYFGNGEYDKFKGKRTIINSNPIEDDN